MDAAREAGCNSVDMYTEMVKEKVSPMTSYDRNNITVSVVIDKK